MYNPILIQEESQFIDFLSDHRQVSWLAFDTEFIGEHRLIPKLCLIQVASEKGIFLLDPIQLKDISPLMPILEDESILKITHAGQNDYALLHILYALKPKNIFDVQIAAGFVGNNYPSSFQKLVKDSVGRSLNKGAGVTDWKSRPLSQKQLDYAADDVRFLYEVYQSLYKKLEQLNRVEWANQEFERMMSQIVALDNWETELLNYRQITRLKTKEQLIIIRLFKWREQRAIEENQSKEAILPKKLFSEIVKNIKETEKTISNNRLLSRSKIKKFWSVFSEMGKQPASPDEKLLLKRFSSFRRDSNEDKLRQAFIKLMIKERCLEHGIPETLLLNGMGLSNPMTPAFPDSLINGWRRQIIGETLVDWMTNTGPLTFQFEEDQCIVKRR